MEKYLRSTDIIDWEDPDVSNLARELGHGAADSVEVAGRCFEWVRDEIRHSSDFQLNPVTCMASEVLRHRTGFCYSKCHLLTALLRANGLPAGLCYQRLSIDGHGAPFGLHGLSAVLLPGVGWFRLDPRGNNTEVTTAFNPPDEKLACQPTMSGETDLPVVYPDPLEVVLESLRNFKSWDALVDNLPDVVVLSDLR